MSGLSRPSPLRKITSSTDNTLPMYNAKLPGTRKATSRVTILVLLLAGLALLQQTVSFGSASRLQIALNNAAHVPWFFVVSCLLWHITGQFTQLQWRQQLLFVAGLALVLATGLEAAQFFTSRDADIRDVGLNLLGACAALLAILATRQLRQNQFRHASLSVALASALIISGFSKAAEILWIQSKRDALAPILIAFDRTDFPLQALLRGDWEMSIDRRFAGPRPVAKVTLSNQRNWPGSVLREPMPDQNGDRWLVLKAQTDQQQILPLELRLETTTDRGMDSTVSIALDDTTSTFRVSLEQLAGDRLGKLDEVRNLFLFSGRPKSDIHFYLESISLE